MTTTEQPGSNSKKQVREYAERINNLINQQAALGEDIKTIKLESKKVCDDKALMKVVRSLRKPASKRNEEQEEFDLVMGACEGLDFSE